VRHAEIVRKSMLSWRFPLALALLYSVLMIETTVPSYQAACSTLSVGVGFSPQPDAVWSVVQAAAIARSRFGAGRPHLALVLTTHVPAGDLVAAVQTEIGPVSVAGGGTAGLFTEHGFERTGSIVVCLGSAGGAASGAVMAPGRDLAAAAQTAARVMLAGWPFRMHYPRGIALALASEGMPARDFLEPWRRLMGPKMRTACAVHSGPPVFTGGAGKPPLASVACLEGAYVTGLGSAAGTATEDTGPDAQSLIHGSIDATRTAMKRLDGQAARLVLVIESQVRQRALGDAAADEWAAIRNEAGEGALCLGWLCDRVAAYGRGVRPVDAEGSLVVIAIGDVPRGRVD
jgi:hypothetical protein